MGESGVSESPAAVDTGRRLEVTLGIVAVTSCLAAVWALTAVRAVAFVVFVALAALLILLIHRAKRTTSRKRRVVLSVVAAVVVAALVVVAVLSFRAELVEPPPIAAGSNDPAPTAIPTVAPQDSIDVWPPVEYGFYPADRAVFSYRGADTTNADIVTINSATDSPVLGDERPFLSLSKDGNPVVNRIEVKPGDRVTVRIPIVNNADPDQLGSEDSMALNVKVELAVPTAEMRWFNIAAFISADNATPGTINDCALLVPAGSRRMKLLYVPGSARLHRDWDGIQFTTEPLSDSLVTRAGVHIGNVAAGQRETMYVTAELTAAVAAD